MINKIISIDEAADMVKEDMTIMVGGFLANGTPERLIDALVEKNVKNLTLICNDTGFP
jgi:acetate CoA/acetoacetate CoA-transferase alpha subunit